MKFKVNDVFDGKTLSIGSVFTVWNTATIGTIPISYTTRKEYSDFAVQVLNELPKVGEGFAKPYVVFQIDKNGIELSDSGHVCSKV